MVEVGDGSEGMEAEQVVRHGFEVLAESDEHDESALTMSDVVNFPVGDSGDVIEGSWQIVHGHIMEGELPEFEYGGAHWLGAVSIAPAVANPNVKSLVCQYKCHCQILIIDDPSITGVD